jgi:hypothetical protein
MTSEDDAMPRAPTPEAASPDAVTVDCGALRLRVVGAGPRRALRAVADGLDPGRGPDAPLGEDEAARIAARLGGAVEVARGASGAAEFVCTPEGRPAQAAAADAGGAGGEGAPDVDRLFAAADDRLAGGRALARRAHIAHARAAVASVEA